VESRLEAAQLIGVHSARSRRRLALLAA